MSKRIFYFLIVTNFFVLAQDTIITYPYNEIKIGPLFTMPANLISSFRVKITDEKDENFTNSKNRLVEYSKNKINRFNEEVFNWVAVLIDTLNEVGNYKYTISYRATKQSNNISKEYNDVFYVKVIYPYIIDEKLINRDTLFWGEKIKFNFAAIGLNDLSKYSYSVVSDDNRVIFESSGYEIDLNAFLSNPDPNIKSIKIMGKYSNNIFEFKTKNGEIYKSEWIFKINYPELYDINLISEESIIDTRTFISNKILLFSYGQDKNNFIILPKLFNKEDFIGKEGVLVNFGIMSAFQFDFDLSKSSRPIFLNEPIEIKIKNKYFNKVIKSNENLKVINR